MSVEDQVNPDVARSNCEQCAAGDRVTGIYLGASRAFHDSALSEASFRCLFNIPRDKRHSIARYSICRKSSMRDCKTRIWTRNTDSYFYDVCFSGGGSAPEEPWDADEFSNLLPISGLRITHSRLSDIQAERWRRPRGCPDFYSSLILPAYNTGQPDYEGAMRHLRTQLQLDPATGDEEGLTEDIRANLLLSVGQSARDMINNVLLIHAWKTPNPPMPNGARRLRILCCCSSRLSKNLKFQSYSKSYVAQRSCRYYGPLWKGWCTSRPVPPSARHFAWMSRLMGTYWRLFMWLQTWSPLYAVLNFVMFWEARSRLGAILSSNGSANPSTMTVDRINEHVAMLNSTAADYVWLVPAIGFGLMWGGSQVLGSILAGSRTAETVAGQVGGQFSRGLGANLEEGPSYRHEQRGAQFGEMIGHDVEPQMTVPTGQGGFRVDSQSGTSEIHDSQGGITSIGANGIRNYKGRRAVCNGFKGHPEWGVPSQDV